MLLRWRFGETIGNPHRMQDPVSSPTHETDRQVGHVSGIGNVKLFSARWKTSRREKLVTERDQFRMKILSPSQRDNSPYWRGRRQNHRCPHPARSFCLLRNRRILPRSNMRNTMESYYYYGLMLYRLRKIRYRC
jgi:hypothetical protein